MKTLLIAVSAIALATPAIAQVATDSTTTTTTTMPSVAVPAAPATTVVPPSSVVPATPAAPVADATKPEAVIAAEFPTYDKDSSGALSRAEFDSWMVALKTKSGAAPMKDAEMKTWLSGSFATADKDKNKMVSQVELTTYLTAGA